MSDSPSGDAWYTDDGPDSDVVLSTRVRLARDLASFAFPSCMKDDDYDRVRSLVFDSFLHTSEPDRFQAIFTSNLDDVGRRILCERGVMEQSVPSSTGCGVIIRTDGYIAAVINDCDHLRIAAFKSGLAGVDAFTLCKGIDDELQQTIQFAANYDRGYLTSSVADCGSGMKVSCRVHLPAITMSGNVKKILVELDRKGISVRDCFGLGAEAGSSLGNFYQISTKTAGGGSEIEQLASLVGAVKYLADTERRLLKELLSARGTEIRDRVYSAYSRAKFSLLLPFRETVELVSTVKLGVNAGLLSGVTDSELRALLYRIQGGHLMFLMKSRKFQFPQDVATNDTLRENHIRSLIVQETFAGLSVR